MTKYFLMHKDKISIPETHWRTGPVYEYTRPVVTRVGGEQGALKAAQGLPSCAPHPVTKHRIHHFVYFSQLNAYKKGLVATWLSGHLPAALKQPDKTGVPSTRLRSACQRGQEAFLSLPFRTPPAPLPACCSRTGSLKNKALGNTGLLQRAGSSNWINQEKKAR